MSVIIFTKLSKFCYLPVVIHNPSDITQMNKDDNKNAGWFIGFDSSINLEHVADFTVDGPYCFRPLTQKHLMRSNGSQAWPAASWQRLNPINQSEWANPPWTTNTGKCWPVCTHLRQSSKSVSRSIKNISPTCKPWAQTPHSTASDSSAHLDSHI